MVKKSKKKKSKKATKKKTKKASKTSKSKKIVKKEQKQKYSKQKAFEMLKKSNISVIPFLFAKKEKHVLENIDKIGYPAILSTENKEVVVSTKEEVLKEFKKLIRLKSVNVVLIRKYIDSALELIVLIKKDPSFGYIASVSMGGQYKDIMKDVKFRICPITNPDAEAMVKELQGFYLLQNKINLDSLYSLIVKLSNFTIKNKIDELRVERIVFDEKNSYVFDVKFS
ncbi:MAG: acetate--CoA ligase family protein [Candidatus Aenigmarchaeota archaeon]|nr:acetate--CoA ligase family protein [Candidatus Aenigmarchaeota archaeon]